VYEDYKQEIRVLERFSGPNPGHKHLIRLRLAFQYGTSYYLLFNWAHGNLVDLWRQTPNPTASPHFLRWLIRQCLGIADGLRKIHLHRSWSNAKFLNGSTHLEDTDKNRGRHGDIKPENILCFKTDEHQYHHLVVSDFGLTRFHRPETVDCVPREKVRGLSRTYRSPEFDTQPYISQAYDMWGLGCLYLEFISWFLVGYQKTREVFQSQRVEEDIPPATFFAEDKFFNLEPRPRDTDPSDPNNAEVKDCVLVVSSANDLQEGYDAYSE
jgi:serine/threonine protein kinase